MGRRDVDGPGQRFGREHVANRVQGVVQRDPREVLRSATDPSAEPEAEGGQHRGERAARA